MTAGLTFALSMRQDLGMRADGRFDAERYTETAVVAERVGFHHVLVPDHVFVPPYMAKVIGDMWLDPFAILGYFAARTSRIELVTGCLVVPYRQPFATAKIVASLDQLSGGRIALGIVPGYMKEEFETFNLPLDERNAMTNEFVRIMIEVWTNDAASYQGKYYSCDGINVKPRCARTPHVPIWVGGSSRQALRRVAEFGDVWNPLGFTVIDDSYRAANEAELAGKALPTSGTTPERLRQDLEFLKGLAADAGRDLGRLQIVVNAGRPGDEDSRGRPLHERAAEEAAGGIGRVVEWFGRYVDAGATGFVFTPPGDSLEECLDNIERFAAEVMPQL